MSRQPALCWESWLRAGDGTHLSFIFLNLIPAGFQWKTHHSLGNFNCYWCERTAFTLLECERWSAHLGGQEEEKIFKLSVHLSCSAQLKVRIECVWEGGSGVWWTVLSHQNSPISRHLSLWASLISQNSNTWMSMLALEGATGLKLWGLLCSVPSGSVWKSRIWGRCTYSLTNYIKKQGFLRNEQTRQREEQCFSVLGTGYLFSEPFRTYPRGKKRKFNVPSYLRGEKWNG